MIDIAEEAKVSCALVHNLFLAAGPTAGLRRQAEFLHWPYLTPGNDSNFNQYCALTPTWRYGTVTQLFHLPK
jgi:hypothetical protein